MPSGSLGVHQLVNRTETAVRFLAFTGRQPDIAVFPDFGKVGAFERRPEGGRLYRIFRDADAWNSASAASPWGARPVSHCR